MRCPECGEFMIFDFDAVWCFNVDMHDVIVIAHR